MPYAFDCVTRVIFTAIRQAVCGEADAYVDEVIGASSRDMADRCGYSWRRDEGPVPGGAE